MKWEEGDEYELPLPTERINCNCVCINTAYQSSKIFIWFTKRIKKKQ